MNTNYLDFLTWRQQHALLLSRGFGGTKLAKAANKVLIGRARALAKALIQNGKNRRGA